MKPNDIIDHHLYEVRLIVAIPDYGTPSTSSKYSALDAIVPHLDDEVIVLGMHEHELTLANVLQTTTLIAPTTTTTTAIATTTNRSGDPVRKTRTKAKATNGNKRWTTAERKEVKQLANKGISHKEIAKSLGRSVSAIDQQIWLMNKGA